MQSCHHSRCSLYVSMAIQQHAEHALPYNRSAALLLLPQVRPVHSSSECDNLRCRAVMTSEAAHTEQGRSAACWPCTPSQQKRSSAFASFQSPGTWQVIIYRTLRCQSRRHLRSSDQAWPGMGMPAINSCAVLCRVCNPAYALSTSLCAILWFAK